MKQDFVIDSSKKQYWLNALSFAKCEQCSRIKICYIPLYIILKDGKLERINSNEIVCKNCLKKVNKDFKMLKETSLAKALKYFKKVSIVVKI